MFDVRIEPRWHVGRHGQRSVDLHQLMRLLAQVEQHASIAEASRLLKLSYRNAWGLLRDAESQFGARLLDTQRGRGATLTPLGQALLQADVRIAARLSPMLQSLASELAAELARLAQAQLGPAALRLQASHGFAVAALLERLSADRQPVQFAYRNSSEALAALARRECDLAGFHVPLGEFEPAAVAHYARWLDPQAHVLLNLAVRAEGLFVAPGNPKRIGAVTDLARPDVRFVNRQEGSGTRMLVDLMLARAGVAAQQVAGHETQEFTHAAVAAHVASGMADVGLGVETAARRFGLDFVPLLRERYFFAVERDALARAPVAAVVEILGSESFRARVDALPGYEATDTGRVVALDEAFGAAD